MDNTHAGISGKKATVIDISLFPNPASSEINIRSNFIDKSTKINIYNGSMQLCISQNFDRKAIDISKMPKGMYFVQIIQNNSIYSKKFIKL